MNADLHSNKREIVGSLQLKEKSKHLPPPQKKIKKITLDTKKVLEMNVNTSNVNIFVIGLKIKLVM